MSSLGERRVATACELVGIAILGPLLVPAALLCARLLSEAFVVDSASGAGWQVLLLLGPALPVYVALLPLLPLGLVRLRRGWRPRRVSLLAACVGVGLLLDAVFYLASS